MRTFIKKHIVIFFVVVLVSSLYANPKQTSQVIKAGHWIYDELATLSAESRYSFFLEAQPITVGEVNFYLNNINYEDLSNSGKASYDRVKTFLNKEDNFTNIKNVRFFLNARLNPEFYVKSNKDIDWSFDTFYKDFPITFDMLFGWGDNLTIEAQPQLGKTPYAASLPGNYMNIPLSGELDFNLPKFAYFSFANTFENWGFSIHVGHEGMKIGQSELPSVIYTDRFATDFYSQFSIYNKFIKYTMNVNQIAKDKYLYLHEVSMKPFKFLNIGCVEGSLLNAPFELRYLNPLFFMHQFASWYQYDDYPNVNTGETYQRYEEGRFCAFLGFHFDFVPFRNLRIYGLYGQNEILDAGGSRTPHALSMPDSIAAQLGIQYDIPLLNSGYIKTSVEALYSSPYYMVKQSPDWSLTRERNNIAADGVTTSWMGTPFGPDNFCVQAKVDYEPNEKWSVGANVLFSIHGENTYENLFNPVNKTYVVFDKDNKPILDVDGNVPVDNNGNLKVTDDGFLILDPNYNSSNDSDNPNKKIHMSTVKNQWYWNYYPSVQFDDAKDKNGQDKAVATGRNMWMTGTPEYKTQISLYGHYSLFKNLDFSGKLNYTFVFNNKNIENKFDHGIEFSVAVKYELF